MITVKLSISIEVDVRVLGFYTDAVKGDYSSESFPSELQIRKVFFEDLDITPVLEKANYDFASMEQECLEKIKNGQV